FHCLGFLKGILDDALGFLFRTAEPRLRRPSAPPVTEASADQARDQAGNQDGYIRHSPLPPPSTATYKTRPSHFGLASLILYQPDSRHLFFLEIFHPESAGTEISP